MQRAWERSLEILRDRVDPQDYENFIRRLHPVATRDRNLLIEAPNRWAVDLITRRYLNLMEEVLSQTVGAPIHVLLQPPGAVQQELFPLSVPASIPASLSRKRPSSLIPTYTFDNFVVGGSNQFAHAASKAVATTPCSSTAASGSAKPTWETPLAIRSWRNTRNGVCCTCRRNRS